MVKAVVGANWGDEGKGKITDTLAEQADVVIRFQGGANAGHTIVNNYGKFALHTLPSGAFHQNVMNIIGNGVALNIPILFREISEIEKRGVPAPNLMISDRCQVVMPYHILFAVVMGFFYSRSLAAGSAGDRILSLVIPIILHTVFELWHFALIEAAGGPRMGSMTTEQVMALPYLSLIQPLSVISGVSYAVFVVLTVIVFVLIGRWGKKGKLRERIDR